MYYTNSAGAGKVPCLPDQKPKRLIVSAKRMAETSGMPKRPEGPPGKASDFIDPIDERSPGDAVVWGRCSARQQDHRQNLTDQVANIVAELERRGWNVVRVIRRIGSGQVTDEGYQEDIAFAAEFAAEHNATLVAEDTTRIIRSIDWTTTNQDEVPKQS